METLVALTFLTGSRCNEVSGAGVWLLHVKAKILERWIGVGVLERDLTPKHQKDNLAPQPWIRC